MYVVWYMHIPAFTVCAAPITCAAPIVCAALCLMCLLLHQTSGWQLHKSALTVHMRSVCSVCSVLDARYHIHSVRCILVCAAPYLIQKFKFMAAIQSAGWQLHSTCICIHMYYTACILWQCMQCGRCTVWQLQCSCIWILCCITKCSLSAEKYCIHNLPDAH